MIGKSQKNDYDRLFRIVVIAAVTALAVLLVLVIALLATGALSKGNADDSIVIITGDSTAGDNSGTEITQTETEPEVTASITGLVLPGGETAPTSYTPSETKEAQTEAETAPVIEPTTEAVTEPPETEPVKITEDSSSIPRYTGLDGIEKEFPGTVLTKTSDMGEDYIDRIVFLGDSLTYGLKVYGLLDGGKNTKQVWVPSNGTLLLNNVADAKILFPDTGSDLTVREAVRTKKPDILVVSLGINGISYLGEKDFISQLSSLIGEVKKESPDTTVILQSMFPVAASYQLQKSINNNKICRGNYWMAKAASECGVYYLNTAEVLVGSDGYLPEDLQSGDGLHISIAAYKLVLEYIRTHGIEK